MNRHPFEFILFCSLVLGAACSPPSVNNAVSKQNERVANAGKYRLVNLTGTPLMGNLNKQENGPISAEQGTTWLKIASEKNLPIEAVSPLFKKLQFSDKLPKKAVRTYYVVAEAGSLKSLTIDNDPNHSGQTGALVRGVNLTGQTAEFTVSVDGKAVNIGEAKPFLGTIETMEVPEGKLIATGVVNGKTFTTNAFDAKRVNAFSIVLYKDSRGKTVISLITNYQESKMSGTGSSATG